LPISGGRFAAGERKRRGKREERKGKRGIGEGKEGGKGREEGREGNGKEEGKGGEGEFASLALGGIDAPASDLSSSKNYRAMTVSPVISKVLEMCLLELLGDFLYSHDLQFGFKKTIVCGHVCAA